MKGRDMFCASQASTAICTSNIIMDQPSSSCSSAYNPGSSPFIDRHNPIIRGERRNVPLKPPCSFQTPISPKPHKVLNKNHNSSAKDRDYLVLNKKPKKQIDQKKKQSTFVKDTQNLSVKKSSGDLITPPGSTRYLLGDSQFFKMLSDHDPVEPQKNQDPVDPMKNYDPVEPKNNQIVKTNETSFSAKNSLKPSSILSQRQDQVVVLRVSLHCKGCEGKVRKHISRMAGVTSFNIDFAAKKVTVVGDVTPLSVLASISKVKNAQLLNPLSVASSHTPANK